MTNLHVSYRDSGSGNGEDADGPANVDLKELVASTRSQPIWINEFMASTRSQPALENSNRLRPYLGSESSAVDGQINGTRNRTGLEKRPTIGFRTIKTNSLHIDRLNFQVIWKVCSNWTTCPSNRTHKIS